MGREIAVSTKTRLHHAAGSDCQKRLRRIFRVSGKQSQIVFDRGAPHGGLSCPFGAIHLLHVGENTAQAASVEFVRRMRTNYARSRLQKNWRKSPKGFFDKLTRLHHAAGSKFSG